MTKLAKGLPLLFVLLFSAHLAAQTTAEVQAGEHFQAAREAEKARDLPTAVSEYREALKLKPEVAEAWTNLGLDLYVLKRDDEAISAFQQAVKRKPDLEAANLFLGMAYLRTNQYDKAIPPLKKAISLNPKELKAYLNLSYAYQEMDRAEDAAAVLQKADELFPKNTEVLYNLGKTYTKLMEKSYKEMAQVDPDSYRFHQVMGDTYEIRRDYPDAQTEYKKALETCPDPYIPGLHYSLGNSYWMEGKWEQAIEQFKQELAITPEDYMSAWKLGDTYLSQRQYDEARTWLDRALKEKPDLGQADRDMGKLLIRTGQPEAAIPYLKKVVQSSPEEPSVHFLLAEVYRKMGKIPEMKAELESFQKLKMEEADRSLKHPDTSALGGAESANERPQEEDSVDDLK
ncbi:MAG TPA: tetratricopeptide repeat protein [Terriglobia bacterium]|nr:tetratricopeptide repeat protein [Terriglobia bacterium]